MFGCYYHCPLLSCRATFAQSLTSETADRQVELGNTAKARTTELPDIHLIDVKHADPIELSEGLSKIFDAMSRQGNLQFSAILVLSDWSFDRAMKISVPYEIWWRNWIRRAKLMSTLPWCRPSPTKSESPISIPTGAFYVKSRIPRLRQRG